MQRYSGKLSRFFYYILHQKCSIRKSLLCFLTWSTLNDLDVDISTVQNFTVALPSLLDFLYISYYLSSSIQLEAESYWVQILLFFGGEKGEIFLLLLSIFDVFIDVIIILLHVFSDTSLKLFAFFPGDLCLTWLWFLFSSCQFASFVLISSLLPAWSHFTFILNIYLISFHSSSASLSIRFRTSKRFLKLFFKMV